MFDRSIIYLPNIDRKSMRKFSVYMMALLLTTLSIAGCLHEEDEESTSSPVGEWYLYEDLLVTFLENGTVIVHVDGDYEGTWTENEDGTITVALEEDDPSEDLPFLIVGNWLIISEDGGDASQCNVWNSEPLDIETWTDQLEYLELPDFCIDEDTEFYYYNFSVYDTADETSTGLGDMLVAYSFNAGDVIDYDEFEIKISINDPSSGMMIYDCDGSTESSCYHTHPAGQELSVGNIIYIYEGSVDLCTFESGECVIDVQLNKNSENSGIVMMSETLTLQSTLDLPEYVGFMDNSSVWGFLADPIENFSRTYKAQNENNCTSTDHGDDWSGDWQDPWCVIDYGAMVTSEGGSITYQNDELCFTDSAGEDYCFNMTISNRVMWFQGDILGGQEEECAVYIQSELFVPSSTYNYSLNAYDENGESIPFDWDEMFNDPAYQNWESDRMSAYNAESANVPEWCNDPIMGWYYWAGQLAE